MYKQQFRLSPAVEEALNRGAPVLALESTIIAHGMPFPQNFEFARQAEEEARQLGVTPATIALTNGEIHIGLQSEDLRRISGNETVHKVAFRDLGTALASGVLGATTVSATCWLAHQAGISVLATGGIGGVHQHAKQSMDISQDLSLLSRVPIIVVSAGAKAILDLPKTMEYLETRGVPVVGYGTEELPAFYSRQSGIPVPHRVTSIDEIITIYQSQRALNMPCALLVANPVPESDEIPLEEMQSYLNTSREDLTRANLHGKEVTPYLLKRLSELTAGRTLQTNIALALNNVCLGARIAKAHAKIKP